MNTSDYYKYATLATAAYVRMGGRSLDGASFADEAANAERQSGGRLPSSQAGRMFDPTAAVPGEAQWNVLSYYGGDSSISNGDQSGFAATLFQQGNEKVLAIRGTEPGRDKDVDLWSADLGQIGLFGIAVTQAVAMANYVMRLISPEQALVPQLKVRATLEIPNTGNFVTMKGETTLFGFGEQTTVYLVFESAGNLFGLNQIADGEKIKLTGHSLGGHLAYVAARLFPEIFDQNVVVFNSAGYDPDTASALGLIEEINRFGLNPLLGSVGASTSYIKSQIANEVGDAAKSLATHGNQRTGAVVDAIRQGLRPTSGFVQGTPQVISLRSEDLPPGDDLSIVSSRYTGADKYGPWIDLPTESNNHVIEPFMDALALHALVEPMKNVSFKTEDYIKVLEASSNTLERSQEGFAEALYKLFRPKEQFLDQDGQRTAATLPTSDERFPPGVGKGLISARNSFHDAVQRIVDVTKTKTGLQLFSIADMTAAEVAALAQGSSAVAFRYALKSLNPFVIVGDNSVYDVHNSAGNGNGPLDLFDAATGNGQMTSAYIADRAEMLSFKNVRNTGDLSIVPDAAGTPRDYVDYRVVRTLVNGVPTDTIVRDTVAVGQGVKRHELQQIAFGSDGDDRIAGSDNDVRGDRIYGGAGADLLSGMRGNDYLEGGVGGDQLLGGIGDDTLIGGADDDVLRGGIGEDTYRFQRNGGMDIIADTREASGVQLGQIWFDFGPDAERLTGLGVSNGPESTVYTLTGTRGGLYTLTFTGDPSAAGILNIFRAGDPSIVTVQAFKSGDFGIALGPVQDVPRTDKFGTAGADTLSADGPDQNVYGLDGHDTITVAFAGDVGYGGPGDDFITNDSGDQWLYGEEGNDTLIATAGDDGLYGGAGDDTLQGGAGNDYLEGADGIDVARGDAGEDVLLGGEGADSLSGDSFDTPDELQGADYLDGEGGNDLLIGGGGADYLVGGLGDDRLDGDASDVAAQFHGDDILEGGEGADILIGSGGADVLEGGAGNDQLFGDVDSVDPQYHGADWLDGGAGDDILVGGARSDTLFGGEGNDQLFGDPANLAAELNGDDYLDGEAGDDLLVGGAGNDTLLGGEGADSISGDAADVAGEFQGEDYIDGGAGNDLLVGGGGADTILGGAGDDTLGGDGDDVTAAFHGDDFLDGGEGNDVLLGYGGADELFGGLGLDMLRGGAGDDVLDGGEDADTLFGDEGADILVGGAGADALSGGEGNDALEGGDGDDALSGGAGQDQLAGGAGVNILDGGAGNDIYTLAVGDGADTIRDGAGIDRIRIEGVAAEDVVVALAGDGQSVSLSYGAGDTVTIEGRGFKAIDQLAFDDGTVRAFKDFIPAGAGTTVSGGADADVLEAMQDLSTVTGGEGDDLMIGGAGDTTYVVNPGDGTDYVVDLGGADTVRFGAGIAPEEVWFEYRAPDTSGGYYGPAFTIDYGAGTIAVAGGEYGAIERYTFADGTALTHAELLAQSGALRISPPNIVQGSGPWKSGQQTGEKLRSQDMMK